jgi:hypothetical protein
MSSVYWRLCLHSVNGFYACSNNGFPPENKVPVALYLWPVTYTDLLPWSPDRIIIAVVLIRRDKRFNAPEQTGNQEHNNACRFQLRHCDAG